MCLRIKNKGMTLIELIISIAISGIILSIIIIIINSASHSFRRTNDEVNLQLEAQVTINQLSNLSMEASYIDESFNKPSTADTKYIITSHPKSYAVLFIKDKMKLYLIEGDTPVEADLVVYSEAAEFMANYLMAEYVDDIEIKGLQTNKVTIDISFALGADEYSVSRKIKLRNNN